MRKAKSETREEVGMTEESAGEENVEKTCGWNRNRQRMGKIKLYRIEKRDNGGGTGIKRKSRKKDGHGKEKKQVRRM